MTNKEFKRIITYVEQKAGINLQHKRVLVEGRLEPHRISGGFADYDCYMNAVEADISGKKAEQLVNLLTTNHTYFMREPEHFMYFKNVVLPELKRKKGREKDLRIWCGASSTGEEPYTLAMIIHDYFALDNKEWNTQLLATDISTEVLKTALKGQYLEEQINPLPDEWKRRYFKQVNEEYYEISQEIKEQVLFRQFNLMSMMPFRKPLQVVFLRNVMIYFDKDVKNDLLHRIYENMEPGGYLFVGTTECVDRKEIPFDYVQPSVYRKMGELL